MKDLALSILRFSASDSVSVAICYGSDDGPQHHHLVLLRGGGGGGFWCRKRNLHLCPSADWDSHLA